MRYLKITLSGAVLFLVYLWITVMLNSCNGNTKVPVETGNEVELLEEEMMSGDFDDEFEGDNDSFGSKPGNGDADAEPSSDYEEDDDYTAGDYTTKAEEKRFKASETKPKSKSQGNTALTPRTKKENANTSTNASSGNAAGQYMLIAGSYLLEENAKKMIEKLQGLGYSNAEIIYFDQSQYHSICAGRFDSSSSARESASNLNGSGIDSYVHRKQ